jgi:hypothetical protein
MLCEDEDCHGELMSATRAALMISTLKKCPSCHHLNPPGAMLCESCNTGLDASKPVEYAVAFQRLAAEEVPAPAPAAMVHSLTLTDDYGHVLTLSETEPTVIIGREAACREYIRTLDGHGGDYVSARHIEVHYCGEIASWTVTDVGSDGNGSTNGTWLNGNKTPPVVPQPLHPGDVLNLARKYVLKVS